MLRTCRLPVSVSCSGHGVLSFFLLLQASEARWLILVEFSKGGHEKWLIVCALVHLVRNTGLLRRKKWPPLRAEPTTVQKSPCPTSTKPLPEWARTPPFRECRPGANLEGVDRVGGKRKF